MVGGSEGRDLRTDNHVLVHSPCIARLVRILRGGESQRFMFAVGSLENALGFLLPGRERHFWSVRLAELGRYGVGLALRVCRMAALPSVLRCSLRAEYPVLKMPGGRDIKDPSLFVYHGFQDIFHSSAWCLFSLISRFCPCGSRPLAWFFFVLHESSYPEKF